MCHGHALLRHLLPLTTAAAMVLAVPTSTRAQLAAATLRPGAKLRVWSSGPHGRGEVGTLTSADSSQLKVQFADESQVFYPWPLVDSLDVSRGKYGGQGRRMATIGAFAGGAALAILVAASAEEGEVIDPGAAVAVAFVAGAVGGALVGGVIGAGRARDRWERVPLQPRVGMRLRRPTRPAVGFAVTLARFR